MKINKTTLYHISCITILFLAQFLFINPMGEFALNDDWVHTDILKHWVDTGDFRMSEYAGPSFYVPILYGAGLIKLLGFSFTILRFSTILLSLFLLVVFYFLLNRINHKPHVSLFMTLALWFNPIFYNLSFTFMTDVPALLFFTISLYCYYQGFDKKNAYYLFWGSVVSIIGFYTRQTNILLMFAAGVYSLSLLTEIKLHKLVLSFGIPTVLGATIYILLSKWNVLPPGLNYHLVVGGIVPVLKHIVWWTWFTGIYFAVFALPVTASFVLKNWKNLITKKLFLILSVVPVVIAAIIRQASHLQFPYVLNIINTYSIGPIEGVIQGSGVSLLPSKIWGIITLFIAMNLGWLIYMFLRHKIETPHISFVHLSACVYLMPILLFESFDRYYLPLYILLALSITGFAKISQKISYVVLGIVLFTYAVISISQTQFYLSFNRIRWEMANTLYENEKMAVNEIDAGYEWNGWYAYWDAEQSDAPHGRWTAPWWIKYLFVNNTEEYIIGLSPIEGYETIEMRKVPGFNPNNHIYSLKKL